MDHGLILIITIIKYDYAISQGKVLGPILIVTDMSIVPHLYMQGKIILYSDHDIVVFNGQTDTRELN